MEHTKHIWRAAALVVLLLASYAIGRHFVVPGSFGAEGFYRADSRLEFMQQPVVHGDRGACAACHADQQELHDGGAHAAVQCEVCHAPLAGHVAGDAKSADMPTDKSRRLCGWCHEPLAARPKAFPQIDARAHLVELGAIEDGDPVPDAGCILCHPPHDPKQDG